MPLNAGSLHKIMIIYDQINLKTEKKRKNYIFSIRIRKDERKVNNKILDITFTTAGVHNKVRQYVLLTICCTPHLI